MLATHSSIFTCYYSTCSKTFATKFNLRRHVNSSHLAIKNHTCPTCQKKFASKQNLNEHLFIHTGEKPFQCTVSACGRRFRQASQLCIHKKTHLADETVHTPPAYFTCIKLTDLLLFAPRETFAGASGPTVTLPRVRENNTQEGDKLPVLPVLINQAV